MDEKDYQKIIEEISSKLSIENKSVDANILALKTKLNSEGMLNSGRFPHQLNELLLNFVEKICNIIWQVSFDLRETQLIKMEVRDVSTIINEAASESINAAEAKLRKEITVGNPEGILKKLDFSNRVKEILEREINNYESTLRKYFKDEQEKMNAFRLAKSGKIISIWSLVLSTIISLSALIVSIIALNK